VRVRVLNVDGSRRRIALTMRNPDVVGRARGGEIPIIEASKERIP
jgi:transcriptional accessory protein Tex/SPT6